jgi:hypothetical protein
MKKYISRTRRQLMATCKHPLYFTDCEVRSFPCDRKRLVCLVCGQYGYWARGLMSEPSPIPVGKPYTYDESWTEARFNWDGTERSKAEVKASIKDSKARLRQISREIREEKSKTERILKDAVRAERNRIYREMKGR